MNYYEITKDLFTVDENYVLAHCIAQDGAMGAGIAVEFVKRNKGLRPHIQYINPNVGTAIYYKEEGSHAVINLITKSKSYHKPSRKDFENSIVSMKNLVVSKGITKLAMPLIGAGLDRLDWDTSSAYIKEIFDHLDVEILVCKL